MFWQARGVRRRGAAIGLAAASALLLAACGQPASGAGVVVPGAETTRPAPASGDVDSVSWWPLRGTIRSADAPTRPSLAAKIDNHANARPQIALNRSDIVFEELVEGGITRYLAVWHSDMPDELGPVRSIRPMDPDIVSPFGGIIAYSGGQDRFVDLMEAAPVVNLVFDFDDTGLFWRADDRLSPHDVILDVTEAERRNADLPPPPMQFSYGTANPLAADELRSRETTSIDIRFSDERSPSWSWDAQSRVWLRSQEGAPDLEASGEQVSATNVVTMRVQIDWSDGEVPRTVLIGSGEATVSSGGRTAEGIWAKPAADEPIALTGADGSLLRLAPGNTWIELVPTDGSVDVSE